MQLPNGTLYTAKNAHSAWCFHGMWCLMVNKSCQKTKLYYALFCGWRHSGHATLYTPCDAEPVDKLLITRATILSHNPPSAAVAIVRFCPPQYPAQPQSVPLRNTTRHFLAITGPAAAAAVAICGTRRVFPTEARSRGKCSMQRRTSGAVTAAHFA